MNHPDDEEVMTSQSVVTLRTVVMFPAWGAAVSLVAQ